MKAQRIPEQGYPLHDNAECHNRVPMSWNVVKLVERCYYPDMLSQIGPQHFIEVIIMLNGYGGEIMGRVVFKPDSLRAFHDPWLPRHLHYVT